MTAKKTAKRKRKARRSERPVWKMRKYEGRGFVDTRKAPDWWLSAPDEAEAFLGSLKGVEVFSIGRSAGGHEILAAAFGERAPVRGRTSVSLASAIAGRNPGAFYGEQRERPTFLFLGAAHGLEIEGTVGMLNALNVAVKGRDLRGRRWPRLAEALRQQRVLVLPFHNIDGRLRFKRVRHSINVSPEDSRLISQGNWKNGEKLEWPSSKLVCPLPVNEIEPLGSYFNDNGMNLVYDLGLGGDAQPETEALIRLLKQEAPDCVLCSHTNNGSLVEAPSSYMPAHFRSWSAQVGAIAGAACAAKGLAKRRIVDRMESYCGQAFYQTDLIYHVSGAMPLLVEFPCGYQNNPSTFDEVLDICMTVIEEIVVFGNTYGYRPANPN